MMITPDEPSPPRAAAAGGVSVSSGLRGPQRRIGCGQRTHRSAREHRGKAKVARQDRAGDLHRRRDMIAVASAMMVRIALVAICRHFVGVTGRMTLGDLFAACLCRSDAGIRPFQSVRRRRRSEGADEHQAGKDVQQTSHGAIRSSNADVTIVIAMARSNLAIIARLPARLTSPRARPGLPPPIRAMQSAGK